MLCACGCGQEAKPGNRYIQHHHCVDTKNKSPWSTFKIKKTFRFTEEVDKYHAIHPIRAARIT
jgi:hypothetical protein